MAGKHLVQFGMCSSPSSSALLKPLLACYQTQITRRIQTGRDKHGEKVLGNEKAASTAEEFLKIAEEKADLRTDTTEDHEGEEVLMDDPGGDIYADNEKLKPGVEEESFGKTPSDDL